MMVPAAVLGLGLSLIAVVLNDIAFTWGYHGLHRVVLQSVEEIAYGVLRKQRTYSTNQFSISVKDVQDKILVSPTITLVGTGKVPTLTITAQEAWLQSDLERNTLSVFMKNSVVEAAGEADGILPGVEKILIPLSDASRKSLSGSPSHMALRKIPQAIATQRQLIRQLEQARVADAGLSLVTGDFRRLASVNWQPRQQLLEGAQSQLNRLRTEPWRRFAGGFSCLCFICVGAPLAVWLRNSDFMTSFFCCFAPILGVYFPLLYVALLRTKAGVFPPFSVWGGNVVCLIAGYWLMRRILKS
jgi:lipopolysaccharide export system permease protein